MSRPDHVRILLREPDVDLEHLRFVRESSFPMPAGNVPADFPHQLRLMAEYTKSRRHARRDR